MAQVIPSITSLPVDSGAAPSVEDIQDRLPSICVDYLSHNWTEEDVWASWRNMTRHKHEIANGVRLENASWRTWNKQRNKLRTISPETLNWLKDSDVTWLYGPLHTANVEPVRPLRISTAQDRLGIDNPAGKPGILKHRTLTELLAMPGQSSPGLDAVDADEAADAIMADVSTGRPQLPYTKSDTNLSRSNSMPIRRRSPSTGLHHTKSAQSKERSPDSSNTTSHKRHISFNTFVEQVISLDEPVLHRGSEDSDDSDDVLEMRLSRFSSHGSRASSTTLRTSSSSTIAKIPPGMLKTAGLYTNNAQLPRLIYAPTNEYRSPVTEQPPAVSPPFGATSPVGIATGVGAGQAAGRRWSAQQQDDDFSKGSFDYFGGPDLTGTSPQLTSPNTATFARVPAVNAPPAQPKWRQAQTGDTNQTGGTLSVSNSSSSSSLNNPASVASPQPGRSILKVRPANNNPAPPEIVSPPVLFNYNPSVATGIGGMFGSYEGAAQAGLAIGSPPNDPSEERGRSSEERGRSTSRGYGSSQYLRSASRNSSSSSVGSVSRSPVDTGIPVKARVQSQPSLDQVKEGAPWRPSPTTSSSSSEAMDVDYSPERSFTPTPHSSPQIVFRPLKDTSPSSLPHASSRVPGGPQDPPMTASPTDMKSGGVADSGDATPQPETPVDDEDGSTLIGRATNIANTAKDLLGALWYGAQDDAARPAIPSPRRHQRGASLG